MYKYIRAAVCAVLFGAALVTFAEVGRAHYQRLEMVGIINELVVRDKERGAELDRLQAGFYELESNTFYSTVGLAHASSDMLKNLDLSDKDNVLYIYLVYKPLIDRILEENGSMNLYPTIGEAVKMWVESL